MFWTRIYLGCMVTKVGLVGFPRFVFLLDVALMIVGCTLIALSLDVSMGKGSLFGMGLVLLRLSLPNWNLRKTCVD
jgi:hypothetical protein